MRIWDVTPEILCDRHLLAEHVELHTIWSVITKKRRGWSNHPETIRWRGKLAALYKRHELLVNEMERRGMRHKSPLDKRFAKGKPVQDAFLLSIPAQKALLRKKSAEIPCECRNFQMRKHV